MENNAVLIDERPFDANGGDMVEDARIVELYWQRDEAALEETQAKYGRYCYGIAMQILHNSEDAAECENDTYLRAWHSIPPHRPRELSAFLGAITRRLSLDKWRYSHADKRGGSQVAVSLHELEECIPDGKAVDETLAAQELAAILSSFLRGLPRTECDVFLRRYWYFDSIEAIGLRYGFGQSKVKMMLKRTRDRLLVRLEKEGVMV